MTRFMSRVLLPLALAWALPASAPADDRPNVVIILADDLGWGDLGCYGHPSFKTPRIDRLASEGVRFSNFYVPVPYCAPSRAALLTGRYPFRCGLTRNPVPAADAVGERGDGLGLPVGETTLADVFRTAGYATGCFGKWHLGHHPEFRPLRRGFDEYLGVLYSNDMHPVELIDGGERVEYPVVQTTLTPRLTDRAIAFLRKHKDGPFFLYFPEVAVHKPLAPSEANYKKSGAGLYGDMVAELDDSVGRILDALRDLGLEKNTLVLFASDNGPWYGGSAGGLRGMKGLSWEGGVRVPCIARRPGKIPAGRTCDAPAIAMDFFPTALAAAGIAPPAGVALDGRDLLPLISGGVPPTREALYFFRGDTLAAVRSGRWKLHVVAPGPAQAKAMAPDAKWVDPRRPDGVRLLAPFEQAHPSQYPGTLGGDVVTGTALFDLETDASEQHNVADAHPEEVKRLEALVARLRAEMPAAPKGD